MIGNMIFQTVMDSLKPSEVMHKDIYILVKSSNRTLFHFS